MFDRVLNMRLLCPVKCKFIKNRRNKLGRQHIRDMRDVVLLFLSKIFSL